MILRIASKFRLSLILICAIAILLLGISWIRTLRMTAVFSKQNGSGMTLVAATAGRFVYSAEWHPVISTMPRKGWSYQNTRMPVLPLLDAPSSWLDFAFRYKYLADVQVSNLFLSLPHWALMIPPILVLFWLLAKSRMPMRDHCPKRGYDLRATLERCPECGHAVNADATIERS